MEKRIVHGHRAAEDLPGTLNDPSKRILFSFIIFRMSGFLSENTSTVRQNSSSDEEETIADAGNDSMDIDNLDRKYPWIILLS